MSTELDQEILEKYQDWKSLEEQRTQVDARAKELLEPVTEWEDRTSKKPLPVSLAYYIFKFGYPKDSERAYFGTFREHADLSERLNRLFGEISELVVRRPGEYPLNAIVSKPPRGHFFYDYHLSIGDADFIVTHSSNGIFARRSTDANATVIIEESQKPMLTLPKGFKILRVANWPYFHNLTHPVYYNWEPLLGENPQAIAPNGDLERQWKKEKEEALTYTDFVLVEDFQLDKPVVAFSGKKA